MVRVYKFVRIYQINHLNSASNCNSLPYPQQYLRDSILYSVSEEPSSSFERKKGSRGRREQQRVCHSNRALFWPRERGMQWRKTCKAQTGRYEDTSIQRARRLWQKRKRALCLRKGYLRARHWQECRIHCQTVRSQVLNKRRGVKS